jgi:hypothetical protein
MHGKEAAISPTFAQILNVTTVTSQVINTDVLGTFSGEVPRLGHPLEVLRKKVQLGIHNSGIPLGVANEGSFGPHPWVPYIGSDHEMMIWKDEDLGIEIVEQLISLETNYETLTVASWDNMMEAFLGRVMFPSHAVIVKPNTAAHPDVVFKGLRQIDEVREAISKCIDRSDDGLVSVQTDMRAHMNPSRMRVIEDLARRMAYRLRAVCPGCGCPGWGVVGYIRGLPCEVCNHKTNVIHQDCYGCPRCDHRINISRSDRSETAEQKYCEICNP